MQYLNTQPVTLHPPNCTALHFVYKSQKWEMRFPWLLLSE